MTKKSTSLFVFVVFLINLFSLSVCAGTTPSVSVGNASGVVGDLIEIPVVLSENSGFSNLAVEIGYDSTVLALKSVAATSGIGATCTQAPSLTVNPYNMSWDSATDTTFNGVLAVLSFEIIADKAGKYPVTVDYYKGRNGNYVDGNNVNYDENFEPLGLVYISGNVTVNSSDNDDSMSVSGISFDLTLNDDSPEGTVYAAIYASDGSLNALKQYPAAKVVNVAFDAGVTGAYIKIMWWNDSLKPMCKVKTITLQ